MPRFACRSYLGDDERLTVVEADNIEIAKQHAQFRDNHHNAQPENANFPRNTHSVTGPVEDADIEKLRDEIVNAQPHIVPADQLPDPTQIFAGPQRVDDVILGGGDPGCLTCP